MSFDETLTRVKDMAKLAEVSGMDFLAVQVNLTGEDGGVFYVEVKDGKISAEPYEYNDRNCALTMSTNDFHKMLDGKLDPILAFTLGKLKVEGDIGKALEFAKIVK